jgi:hypothetical protein
VVEKITSKTAARLGWSIRRGLGGRVWIAEKRVGGETTTVFTATRPQLLNEIARLEGSAGSVTTVPAPKLGDPWERP